MFCQLFCLNFGNIQKIFNTNHSLSTRIILLNDRLRQLWTTKISMWTAAGFGKILCPNAYTLCFCYILCWLRYWKIWFLIRVLFYNQVPFLSLTLTCSSSLGILFILNGQMPTDNLLRGKWLQRYQFVVLSRIYMIPGVPYMVLWGIHGSKIK